ncbi:MAG TPA: electron transport complex subunit RsxE [Syntrophobacteraceae bacterium]|nr:electron transport complex subunit RsxE [Syntrophobacteraceae bacterium]
MAKTLTQEFTKGLWAEIPPFRLVLGLCPTLAITNTVENAYGMGIAVTFVLTFSNIMISAMRKIIPPKVRIVAFIVAIATFVCVVELVMQAYTYSLFMKLGIYIPLIVVNCIIMGRAEAFASRYGIMRSMLDGLGLGIGYTLALSTLATFREIIATGSITLYEKPIAVLGASFEPFKFLVAAPGAFICLGLMLGIMNILGKK